MAFKKITPEQVASLVNENGLLFNVDNGDLVALRAVLSKWGFRDEESALRFALAVMKQAEKGVVFIDRGDGAKVGLSPSDDLLRELYTKLP